MEINPQGIFHCHNCGHSGSLYDEFPDHFDDLSDYFSWVKVSPGAISSAQPKPVRINQHGKMWSSSVVAPGETISFAALPDDHPAVEYMRIRGFDIEELRSFSLSGDIRSLFYCTEGQHTICEGLGSLAGRIVIPVYGEEMRQNGDGTSSLGPVLRGWQARYVDRISEDLSTKFVWSHNGWREFRKLPDGEWGDSVVPKYYTCPGMKKSLILGGLTLAKTSRDVAVVEGPLDYYKAGRHCVYTFGDSVSEDQIRMIKNNWDRVFILRDPEVDVNSKKFKRVLDGLYPLQVYHLCLSGDRDPGKCSRQEIWQEISSHVGDSSLTKYATD